MDWADNPFALLVKQVLATRSVDEIARHCAVMRSTVPRWADGSMYPHPKAVPHFEEKLREMLAEGLDDVQNAVRVARKAVGDE